MTFSGARYAEEYAELLRKFLEADGRLLPHPAGYAGFLERRQKIGRTFMERRLPAVAVAAPDHLERLSRIAGQGAIMAEELLFQWSADAGAEASGGAIDACALFNLMIACFDQIIDHRPKSSIALRKIMSRARIADALAADSPGQGLSNFDAGNAARDPAVSFVADVAGQFFLECHALRRQCSNAAAWDRLAKGILEAYDAELATVDLPLTACQELGAAVDHKAAMSGEIIGSVAFLSASIRPEIDRIAALKSMTALGRLSGLVDDLSDLVEDIESAQANALLLTVADLLPTDRAALSAATLLDAIVDRSLLAQSVAEVGEGLQLLMAAPEFADSERFYINARLWLSCWFP